MWYASLMPDTEQDKKREAHERYSDALLAEQKAKNTLLEAERALEAAAYSVARARDAIRRWDPKP